MSGGFFNCRYINFEIDDIANEIDSMIEHNGKVIEWDELDSYDKDFYRHSLDEEENKKEYYKNPIYYTKYSQNVLNQMKLDVELLKRTSKRFHELDYYLSCDTGEEDYIEDTTIDNRHSELKSSDKEFLK